MNNGTSQPNVEGSPHGAVERVSVIIPAFNAETTLAETLDSLLAQTYPHWEALVVNDGSTDRTAAIVAAYAERDERIVLLAGAGEGVSAARNRGIAAAQGRLFLFLDADDWIEPHHLETMIAALTAHPDAVAAYCRARSVSPQGRLSADKSLAPVAARPFEMFSRSCHIAIHAVLLPRDVVLGLGGFDTSLRTCEDWDLWQRIARRGGRWVYVDEVLSYYRLRENSLSRNIPQLLEDAETVIRRGFGRDERVPHAAAEHLEGARPADLTADLVVAEVGLWYATLDRLEGGNGEAMLSFLARQPQPPAPASILAETLFYATAEALQAAPETLAARWPDFGPALTRLIADLGALWDDPVAARRLQYRLEKLILERGDCSEPRTLALTMGLTLDPLDSRAVTLPAGIDRLYLRLVQGHWRGLDLELGVLGTVTRRQILQLLLECYGMKSALKAMPAGAWPVLIARFSLHAARAAIRGGRRMLRRSGFRALLLGAGRDAILGWVGSANGGHAAALEELRREVEARAAAAADIRPQDKPTHGAQWARARRHGDRQTFWDDIFRDVDPWNYASPYEQEKYDRQLDLLPEAPGLVLELACAEGRFTERLAPRVGQLIATDIASKAVERARARCSALGNVEVRQLDLIADPLPEGLDLIVCSEVLYFLKGTDQLAEVAARFAAALKPGGRILAAHAFVLQEDKTRTGFDWPNPFGVETIAQVIGATPGLVLERSLATELYRIDRFMRIEPGVEPLAPVRETLPIAAAIGPEIARQIVWGGAVATRTEVRDERRNHVPVLMYHRIAEEGPDELAPYRVAPGLFREQMAWLRRHGYHALNAGEVGWFLRSRSAFAGRPVLLSFDDGYQDFADVAWPVLREHDFTAEVFVVTDLVGRTSEWDKELRAAFPLMDAETIARLHAEGAHFGSHLASHRAADGLSTRELAAELLRSRSMLWRWLGIPPQSIAAPFGLSDERLRRLAAECGYTVGFGTHPGAASFSSHLLELPRIEVRGEWTMKEFAAALEIHL